MRLNNNKSPFLNLPICFSVNCCRLSSCLLAIFCNHKLRNFAVKHVKIMETKHDAVFMGKAGLLALALARSKFAFPSLRA